MQELTHLQKGTYVNPPRKKTRSAGLHLVLAVIGVALLAMSCSGADAGGRAERKVWGEGAVDDDAVNAVRAECAEEAGLPYEVLPDGAFFIPETPRVSKESVSEVMDRCQERLIQSGLAPDPDRPRNATELGLQHAAFAKTVACLRKHGWPTFDAPSRKAFAEVFDNPDAVPSLYGPVLQDPSLDYEHVFETCPYTY